MDGAFFGPMLFLGAAGAILRFLSHLAAAPAGVSIGPAAGGSKAGGKICSCFGDRFVLR